MNAHQMEEKVPVPPGLHRQVCPHSLCRASAPSSQGPNGLFFCAGPLIPVKDPSEGIGRPAQLRAPKQGSSENPLHPGGAPGPSATFPEEPW